MFIWQFYHPDRWHSQEISVEKAEATSTVEQVNGIKYLFLTQTSFVLIWKSYALKTAQKNVK